jgi:hypothetical protein
MTTEFPNLVSYNRFVELSNKHLLPLVAFLRTRCLGQCTGISYVDSTPLRACHIKREHSHRVMKGLATKGQCSIGWFYGLKLHFIVNDRGEILDFVMIPGNIDDRKPLTGTNILSRIYGKLFGDKGYISQSIFEQLFIDGIHLITKLRKNICQIEHTRHRSPEGFIVNLIAGLIAYYYLPKKPSLNLEVVDPSMVLAC